MSKKIVIATRNSQLALWQAYHIKERIEKSFPDIEVSLNEIVSRGDKVLDRPLALIGGKGHFTKELEEAMLRGEANLAVHSLKDVPTYIPDGLELAAITKRQDQSDVFLSHKYASLQELPQGAVVGTTSLRRRMQLLQVRPDLKLKDLRGNVNTRLRKLKDGEYDAIILAYIGLHRLNLLKDIPYVQKLPLSMMIPPMGQAALGIEIVADDALAKEVAKSLNDSMTQLCTQIERDFIAAIGAGCSAPVACNAYEEDGEIIFRVMLGFPDGSEVMQEQLNAMVDEAKDLGKQMADLMIAKGAIELLQKAQECAFKDERPERI
ncbi:Porphobilinogen deaminase [hydrothermal vent metagenome]|uniref:hydroxymethylbilane synthase n=1 Tax=hydrothermal vent metagenome TaxID=652676 RepID=A0A1W1BD78_9ZZZZ